MAIELRVATAGPPSDPKASATQAIQLREELVRTGRLNLVVQTGPCTRYWSDFRMAR